MSETDWITFGLAIVGYALLGVDLLGHARGRPYRAGSLTTAVVVVAHVACVWNFRLRGSLSYALDKGLAGFVMFHGALALIVIAALVPSRRRTPLLAIAFGIVTLGALGATLRYPEVAVLRLAVVAIALVKGGGALLAWRRRVADGRPPGPR